MNENILIETEEKLIKLNLQEILYLKSDGCYTEFFLSNGTKLFISKLLKEVEGLLTTGLFFRCHKSYIVNIAYFKELKKCKKGKYREIFLFSGQKIPLATRRVNDFKKIIKQTVSVTLN